MALDYQESGLVLPSFPTEPRIENVLIVATIDGILHAVDKLYGRILWSLNQWVEIF